MLACSQTAPRLQATLADRQVDRHLQYSTSASVGSRSRGSVLATSCAALMECLKTSNVDFVRRTWYVLRRAARVGYRSSLTLAHCWYYCILVPGTSTRYDSSEKALLARACLVPPPCHRFPGLDSSKRGRLPMPQRVFREKTGQELSEHVSFDFGFGTLSVPPLSIKRAPRNDRTRTSWTIRNRKRFTRAALRGYISTAVGLIISYSSACNRS